MKPESTLAAALAPTPFIDSDHPAVRAFAEGHARGADVRERAVSLYLAVRDGFRYDPYRVDLSPTGMRASTVLANGTPPADVDFMADVAKEVLS